MLTKELTQTYQYACVAVEQMVGDGDGEGLFSVVQGDGDGATVL